MDKTIVYSEKDMLQKAKADPTLRVTIVDHPLIRQNLAIMRSGATDMMSFRTAVHRLTPQLIYAATNDLVEAEIKIETPLADMIVPKLATRVVLIPVLRSGIGMHEPAQNIFPEAPTIFAGMARDEATAIAHWYYDLKNLPGLDEGSQTLFLILDPMLATGGSSVATVKRIKEVYPKGTIKMVAMISSPEGIRVLSRAYPDVEIITAAVDDHLNEQFYIVPGLGDAGDRQFGTT
jgi:uracil phosphoribosyltransferase